MKRIVCMDLHTVGSHSQYDVQSAFIQGMHDGLLSEGLKSRLIVFDRQFPGAVVEELIKDRPDCTLSFNGVPDNDQGDPVCVDIKLSHIAVLVDAPFYAFNAMRCPYVLFTCCDRSDAQYYQKMGFDRLIFLPHATTLQPSPEWNLKRKYDVVMLSTPIDPKKERKAWDKFYPPELSKLMEDAAELVLNTPELNVHQAFLAVMENKNKKLKFDTMTLQDILKRIEVYYRAKDRIELIKAIKDVRVDLFGQGINCNWRDLIRQDNVVFHDAVEFKDALRIMHESRIVLNSSPMIKDGAHERVFAGLMSGAFIFSSFSKYLNEQFPDGSGIRFYQPGQYDSVNLTISDILADEGSRVKAVKTGYELVKKSHTWTERAKELHVKFGPIVDAMNRQLAR